MFYDQATNEPAWLTIRGLEDREAFVPIAGARVEPSGVTVAVRKDVIEGAPVIEAGSELRTEDAVTLDRYYSGRWPTEPTPPSGPTEPEGSAELTGYQRPTQQ